MYHLREFAASLILDRLCGCILVLSLVVGASLNLLALLYFTFIRKKTLAEKLYTVVTAIDFTTCVTQIPVMLSLLSEQRAPVLFKYQLFCAAWVIIFEFLQRCSVFVVMLLSITRTIAITYPFYNIRQNAVLVAIIPYSFIILINFIIGISFYKVTFIYLTDLGYGIKVVMSNPASDAQKAFQNADNILYNIEILAPSIVVFISFIVSIVKLRRCEVTKNGSNQKLHAASVTITLFTFMFMVLNLPLFVALTCLTVDDVIRPGYPGIIFSTWFMYWHSFVISKVVLVSANAALNPVLYFLRMPKLKRWVQTVLSGRIPDISQDLSTMGRVSVDHMTQAMLSRSKNLQNGNGICQRLSRVSEPRCASSSLLSGRTPDISPDRLSVGRVSEERMTQAMLSRSKNLQNSNSNGVCQRLSRVSQPRCASNSLLSGRTPDISPDRLSVGRVSEERMTQAMLSRSKNLQNSNGVCQRLSRVSQPRCASSSLSSARTPDISPDLSNKGRVSGEPMIQPMLSRSKLRGYA